MNPYCNISQSSAVTFKNNDSLSIATQIYNFNHEKFGGIVLSYSHLLKQSNSITFLLSSLFGGSYGIQYDHMFNNINLFMKCERKMEKMKYEIGGRTTIGDVIHYFKIDFSIIKWING